MRNQNANDEMDELIRRRTQVDVPAGVEERLRGRLTEFRTRVHQRPPNRWRVLAYSLMRPPAVRVMAMTAVILVAVVTGLVLIPGRSSASRVYAAAAEQLRSSQSLEYTIVLNDVPYVAVDFSYLAPGRRRLSCSWGIEVRTDDTAGQQTVLMHATRTYLREGGKQAGSQANTEDFVQQLRSLPPTADELLGERWAGQRRLIGYRLRHAPNGSIPGLKELDIWINAGTREADHVDITVQEEGKPVHQMHINNIRVGAEVNRSLFDLTPPAGYTPIAIETGGDGTAAPTAAPRTEPLRARVEQSAPMTAVVMPMQGRYAQTRSALEAVESYLRAHGVSPVGHPFGRYRSEKQWDAGYPVPPGTRVEAPFELVSLPGGLAASVVVNGPWGNDFYGRWAAFLKSVVEQGYVPAGQPMAVWLGEETMEKSQSTEMRIAVTKAK